MALRSGPSGSVSDDMCGFPSVLLLMGTRAAGWSGLAGAGGPGRPGWAGGRAAARGAGLGIDAALVVAFEAELLFGVLGAGLPGAGESLDRVDLGGARCGLGVAFAGGVGVDVVVLGAGVGFGLPCPADLGAGVLAGLGGVGQRGVPPGTGGISFIAGLGDGGFGLRPDPGDTGICLITDGAGAGIGSVRVGAGTVSCFQRRPGIVAGLVHRRGGGLGVLDGPGGLGLGHGGFGLGLTAGGVRCGQRRGDPAGISGGQFRGSGARQLGGLGEQLLQPAHRAVGCGALPGPGAGGAAVVMPFA